MNRYTHSTTKVKNLIGQIRQSVLSGQFAVGDNLPSINEASAIYGVSRDTIFKAYKELKLMGLIDSNPTKGYFVVDEVHHVLLLLDTYSSFKQELYRRFVSNLPEQYKVDVLFHQYNEKLFDSIVKESIGMYSTYVVMNFSNDTFSHSLKLIPVSRLLLIDFGNFDKAGFSYICQDFDHAFFLCLKEAIKLFSRYKKLVMVLPQASKHPESSFRAFVNFCRMENFDYQLIRESITELEVVGGTAYILFDTDEMVHFIKQADQKNFILGSDVGLVAYNNQGLLEVVKNGITSFSIDFGLMGEKAASFVKTGEPVHEYLETNLIQRASL